MAVIEFKCAIPWAQLGKLQVRLRLHFCPLNAKTLLADSSNSFTNILTVENRRHDLGGCV